MPRRLAVVLLLVALPVGACARGGATDSGPGPQTPPDEVLALLEAFNRQDAEGMGRRVTEDVEVIYIDDNGRAETGTRSRTELVEQMRGYFEHFPDARSEAENILEVGRFLGVSESVSWTRDGKAWSQRSLSVYEIRDGLIARVWYFPAQR